MVNLCHSLCVTHITHAHRARKIMRKMQFTAGFLRYHLSVYLSHQQIGAEFFEPMSV
jgi:hypothetical protein